LAKNQPSLFFQPKFLFVLSLLPLATTTLIIGLTTTISIVSRPPNTFHLATTVATLSLLFPLLPLPTADFLLLSSSTTGNQHRHHFFLQLRLEQSAPPSFAKTTGQPPLRL
jgi:hypothetical protein